MDKQNNKRQEYFKICIIENSLLETINPCAKILCSFQEHWGPNLPSRFFPLCENKSAGKKKRSSLVNTLERLNLYWMIEKRKALNIFFSTVKTMNSPIKFSLRNVVKVLLWKTRISVRNYFIQLWGWKCYILKEIIKGTGGACQFFGGTQEKIFKSGRLVARQVNIRSDLSGAAGFLPRMLFCSMVKSFIMNLEMWTNECQLSNPVIQFSGIIC